MGPLVLLVTSPGVGLSAYAPLVQELRVAGAEDVLPVVFPCSGDAESLRAQVVRAAGEREVVVLAHGVGATLALQAADELSVRRWVLLGPVLDARAAPGTLALAALPLGDGVDLAAVPEEQLAVWAGRDASGHLGCLSSELAGDLQEWIRAEHVPFEAVPEPVWLAVGQLDEVAPVESTLPASRLFPDRTAVRPGLTRLDPRDYRHLDLVTDPVPRGLAAKAAVEGW